MTVRLRKAGGNWVEGERFFDRDHELATLVERCQDGTHTLLTAQRRMGKTSVVRELLRRLKESGEFETVFVDLEATSTPQEAIAEIWNEVGATQSAWHRAGHRLRQLGRDLPSLFTSLEYADVRVQLQARVNAGNWQRRGANIWQALAHGDKPVVFAMDEFPILINRLLLGDDYLATSERRAVADEFLSRLRKMGQQYQGRVTMILTGSVGLQPILRQAGLTALVNIFEPFELRPWKQTTASGCLRTLAETYGVAITDDLCADICSRLRCCVPHHIQQFFAYLHDHLRRDDRTEATVEDIEQVYSGTLLSTRGQLDLDHYENRLKMLLGPANYTTALSLLTEAANDRGWLHHRTVSLYASKPSRFPDLEHVLYVLEHDGYLTRETRGYRFTSGLLEDWWRARHVQHFVPIVEQ